MRFSESYASPAPTDAPAPSPELSAWIKLLVWICRIVVGGTFIASGVAKCIDVWGVFYKISDYEAAWGIDVPRSITLAGAYALSLWEGLLGFMLLLGCYRRGAVWLLLATMGVMLPLSIYIYLYNPVADCGCFGDMIVISNSATFYKNILLTGALIFLVPYNKRVLPLISRYLQWVAGAAVTLYLLAVAVLGYSIQPLIDFRAFPEGTMLAESDDDDAPDAAQEYEFIYERDGRTEVFTVDSLPDESWTFVDRRPAGGGTETHATTHDNLVLYDSEGDDATAEAISPRGEQILVLIPDIDRIDISFTSYLNALYRHLRDTGGSMAAVLATDHAEQGIALWRDLAMAEYPIYTADPTQIKALARGHVALVYLRDGRVVWKRTAASVDGETLIADMQSKPLDSWRFDGRYLFASLSWALAIILIFIIFADAIRRIGRWLIERNRRIARRMREHRNN